MAYLAAKENKKNTHETLEISILTTNNRTRTTIKEGRSGRRNSLECIRNHHSLYLVIWSRNTLKGLQALQCSCSTLRLVGNHSAAAQTNIASAIGWRSKGFPSLMRDKSVNTKPQTSIHQLISYRTATPAKKHLTWHVILKKAYKYSSNDTRKNKTDCPHRGWITHPRMVLQRIRAGARKWIGPLLGLVFILFLRNLKYFIFCLTSPPDKHISSHRTTTCCSQTTKKRPPSLLSNCPQATGKEIPQNPLAVLPYAIILCTKSRL